jgi:hypothetical protein
MEYNTTVGEVLSVVAVSLDFTKKLQDLMNSTQSETASSVLFLLNMSGCRHTPEFTQCILALGNSQRQHNQHILPMKTGISSREIIQYTLTSSIQ